jgi:PIN domain nuclease of toxin-antitoxin system
MSETVLDASAIVAVIKREPGFDNVLPVLFGGIVSSINIAEVVTWYAMRNFSQDNIRTAINDLRVRVMQFDQPRAVAAGLLACRTMRRGLSLADRACLALALELGLPVLTADRAWVGLDLGVDVRLIR